MEDQVPASMDRHIDVLDLHPNGGLLVGASSLTGRYWLGSLWFYSSPDGAPDVNKCTAGVQLEAGLRDAAWVDAQRILVGLDTGGLAVWELLDDNKVFRMLHSACEHDGMTSSVSVNSDKSRYLSASYDHTVKIWNADLTPVHTYGGHSDIVWNVQCHPTEPALFMSCSQDGKAVLWDTRDSKPASVLVRGDTSFAPTCAQWQPSHKHMYTVGNEEGKIWIQDLRSVVEKTVSFKPHNRFINRLKFCADRPSLLASTSEDCTAVVASVSSSEVTTIYKSTEHKDFVCGVTWNGADKLLTTGYDGQLLRHTFSAPESNPTQVNGDISDDPPPQNSEGASN